jgi:hypothetical protein
VVLKPTAQVTAPDGKTMPNVRFVFVTTQPTASAMIGCPYDNMLVLGSAELRKLGLPGDE